MVLVQGLAIVTISSLFANVASISFCGTGALKSNLGPGSFTADDYKPQTNRKEVDKAEALADGFTFFSPESFDDGSVRSLITYEDFRSRGYDTVNIHLGNDNQGTRKHTMQLAIAETKETADSPIRLMELDADPGTEPPGACAEVKASWIDEKYITIQVIDTP